MGENHTELVFNYFLASLDGQDATFGGTVLRAGDGPSPNISQITVFAHGPLGGAGGLYVQAAVERHSMRSRVPTIDGRLAFLSDG
jgi:hypothetical protein